MSKMEGGKVDRWMKASTPSGTNFLHTYIHRASVQKTRASIVGNAKTLRMEREGVKKMGSRRETNRVEDPSGNVNL